MRNYFTSQHPNSTKTQPPRAKCGENRNHGKFKIYFPAGEL